MKRAIATTALALASMAAAALAAQQGFAGQPAESSGAAPAVAAAAS